MKFLHKRWNNQFYSNEFIFKHKKDYLFIDQSFKNLTSKPWRIIIYFSNNYYTVLKYGSKFALIKFYYDYSHSFEIRISKDIFGFDYYHKDLYVIEINESNLSGLEILKECFDIYEIFK